ncbi:phosphoesterase family-domain-containing protein [Ilyonectria destructans]|nr:phosphoesterase family-domain-containing protein [Ilyonectria destructans]
MLFKAATVLAVAGLALASPRKPDYNKPSQVTGWETKYTATGTAEVAAAAATAKTSSPTSKVKGKSFDRIAIIYFENENYDKAIGDPNFAWFASKGITLSNYFGVTHPSEPNYLAAIAGDYFGMQNDAFNRADANISTVIDLLEHRGVSWAMYQEDMPYSGYEGFSWVNQKNGANDYVRKHNPAVLVDKVASSEQRLSQIKNLSMIDTKQSMFHKDLKANKLPQWMFITPNMTSDGHDTSATVAGAWCRSFLGPLMEDKHFMDNTLVLITWDENETYAIQNNILAILVGDAVPKHLVGTTDNSFYNHYSEIATVQANWGLPTLGRWDVGANVFKMVGKKTGDKIRKWTSEKKFENMFWNFSYAGYFNSDGGNSRYPAPNLDLEHTFSGRKVYGPVKEEWKKSNAPTYYKDTIELPDGLSPPKGYAPVE